MKTNYKKVHDGQLERRDGRNINEKQTLNGTNRDIIEKRTKDRPNTKEEKTHWYTIDKYIEDLTRKRSEWKREETDEDECNQRR